MDRNLKDAAVGCGGLLGIWFIALPLLILLHSWALMLLWKWFLVPLGVAEVSIAHAYGLLLLASLLTHENIDPYIKEEKTPGEIITHLFLRPIFSVFLGVVTLYLGGML